MTVVTLTPVKAGYNTSTNATLTAGHTDGVEYVLPSADEKTMVLVYNSSTDTNYDVTIVKPAAGKGTFAASPVDVVVEVPFGKVSMIMVESAKFLDVTTGKINLDVENAALKFAVFYND